MEQRLHRTAAQGHDAMNGFKVDPYEKAWMVASGIILNSFPARRWDQRSLRLQLAWSRRARGSRPHDRTGGGADRTRPLRCLHAGADLVFRAQRNQGPSRVDGNFLYHYP
jgi:hypothetical protein